MTSRNYIQLDEENYGSRRDSLSVYGVRAVVIGWNILLANICTSTFKAV
jgi:hypothetical protein